MEMSLINTIVSEEDVIYEEDFNEESSNTSSENEEEVYITKNTSVETILHSLTPIEYLPTSINGVAIIFHVEGWQNADAAFTDVNIFL
ncbi:hypothetical protein Glove_44g22 [Diversispora epigaea]|uniref:Uncharacterized protein n=1 Tax=Diversispora epigaea TaxID=1348612 RepID=A0A397JLF3_9GLOM|nr:hypothetical protein Glove_44g22 [Diversispora epigaea]